MKMTKRRIVYTAIVTLIVVFSSTFAILMTLERTDYRNYLQGEYSKNMYDLISSVQNIRVNLGKAAIVGSKEQSIIVFEEIFRNAAMANDKLHSLPVPQETLENSSKFLSQVGDFCYTLGKVSSEGRELSEKDYQTIDSLKNRSFQLEANLKEASNQVSSGKVKWGEIRKRVSGVFAKNNTEVLSEKFKGIQKQVAQYPALIYDGPFSDNVVNIEPRVNSERAISQKEGDYQGTTTPHWQQHSALPLVEVLLISGAFPEVGVWQTARRFFFCWSERPSFHAKHQAADDIVIVNSSLFLHFVGYACRPYKSAQPDYARDHGTAPDCGSSAQP